MSFVWPAAVALSTFAPQPATAQPAVPVEPVSAILDAFRFHDIVALGEGAHNNEQGHAFRMSLIRDARFPNVVNDIVVECGNARYQDVIDRFIRGDDVPDDVLRQVWENAAVTGTVWDVPIYEEFFRGVRAVNASLQRERQLRVLLGDAPIDWSQVRSADDYRKWLPARDTYPSEVIDREVLAKHRRALVIYGDGHLWRKGVGPNLITRMERTGANVFTVATLSPDLNVLQPDAASWHAPSIAVLRGTVLGMKEVAFFFPEDAAQAGEPVRSVPMQEEFDALLYLGPEGTITMSRLSPVRCSDPAYMEMRLKRLALMPGSQGQIDRLKRYCAAVTQK